MAELPECLACGACCFSQLEAFVRVTGDDYERLADRAEALVRFDGFRGYMRMSDGHCGALVVDPQSGRWMCSAYPDRPQICRDLARGSGECRAEIEAKADRPLVALRRAKLTGVEPPLEIRLLRDEDSREELTELLHRAYAELGAMGFRYRAVDQDVDMTRKRLTRGDCYVAVHADALVGTVLLQPPSVTAPWCEWYNRPDVAVLSQFAVDPRFQRRGWGGQLMARAEQRALELGAAELTVDTAEGATHLVELYLRRGYRRVGLEQWEHTNYRSVLLSKQLSPKSAQVAPT